MNKKISELTDASALDGSEQLEVVQGGASRKTTINTLPSFYTTDGNLTALRTVQMDGNDLAIINANLNIMYLIVADGNQKVLLNSYDETGINSSQMYLQSNSDIGYEFALTTSNGVNTVSIEGNADENVLEYTAANHVFSGLQDLADDAAAASAGVPVNGLYHTSGTIKIRLS